MNNEERLNLKKIIGNNDEQETTNNIRNAKHSSAIRADVDRMQHMKRTYMRLSKSNPKEFDLMCRSKCSFLYDNYTEIFNKVKRDEIDLELLNQFLNILRDIEDGKIDEHDGSYKVGTILKKIYIDSALQREKNENRKGKTKRSLKKPEFAKEKKISWAEYKAKQEKEKEKLNSGIDTAEI